MSVSSFLGGLADPNHKFNRVMTRAFDVLLLNGLFLLTSIPIVTSGASSAALYYATSKAVYHDRGGVAREYFRAWKSNLRQGIALQLIFLALSALAALDLFYALHMTSAARVLYLILGLLPLFLLLPVYIYVYPLLSRVEGRVNEYLFMAARMCVVHLLPTLPLLLLLAVLIVLTVMIPPLILVTPGLFAFLSCPWIEKVLKKHLNYNPAGQEENKDAWYRE